MVNEHKPPFTSVAALLEAKYGVRLLERENPEVTAVGVAAVTILKNHPGRVAFILINLSANNLYVAPNAAVSTSLGVFVPPGGGMLSSSMEDDFTLPTREWWAIAGGAASAIYLLSLEIYGGV
jgi:hypothetical protein